MIWKTDWNSGDNHAQSGTDDLDRLLSNYNQLKEVLNTQFGFMVIFTTPPTKGYRTFAFQDLLNGVESCMNLLHVWTVEWIEKVVTWHAAGIGPNFDDINRWEKNGAALEQAAIFLGNYYNRLVSGQFYSGGDLTVQKFSRGR